MRKSVLSWLLALSLLVGLLPTTALAATTEPTVNVSLEAGSKFEYDYIDPPPASFDVKEMFDGTEVTYDGWQLMKLVLTIPSEAGLTVTCMK